MGKLFVVHHSPIRCPSSAVRRRRPPSAVHRGYILSDLTLFLCGDFLHRLLLIIFKNNIRIFYGEFVNWDGFDEMMNREFYHSSPKRPRLRKLSIIHF
ncbi:MAG TPA: hypothetical protein ENJ53_06670 [Phaeodactylibacter sp.]|nr:hypothetical protein [Phaeodactylibacter sp.]